jgi:GTP-binding protein EngB required for normal cell division
MRSEFGVDDASGDLGVAGYRGVSAVEGLAALAPGSIGGRIECGGAVNGPYQACYLTRVGGRRMTSGENALVGALRELAVLGTERDREQVAAIRDRLASARLRVLVVGEAKRGKSTLVNALLGRVVLPAGVTPLTAVVTTVRYGDDPHAVVRFRDGHEEKQSLGALGDLVTERGNPGNRRRIGSVTVYVDAPVLAGGVELVDTPGTGSVFEWGSNAAHEALKAMDAAVFVLTADPPVSASERDLMGRVAELSVTTFAVLNKADHLDEAGLAEASEFTRRMLGEVTAHSGGADSPARSGHAGRVYPMSARAALDAGDPGFARFAADFSAYLDSQRTVDLNRSAIAQARRIAGSLLDEVALTRRAVQMRAGDAARRVGQFSERLAGAAVHSRDAVRIVNAESARLLFAVNDSADEEVPRLSRDVGRRLEVILNGDLRAASSAEIGLWGGMRLVTLTLEAVGAWRAQRQDDLEQGLVRLDARLAAGLKTELDVLRGSADELLGLDLAVPEPGGRLTGDRRFFPATAEDAGQAELLASAVRRRLPGEIGRRRARDHLRSEVRGVVASQVDLARADLQGAMAGTTRTLAEVVERRYADGTERMQAALWAAADLRESSTAEAGRKQQELADREAALRAVLGLLGRAAGPGTRPGAAAGLVHGMRLWAGVVVGRHAEVDLPVEEGGEPSPGALFAALRLVPAVPGLLLRVLLEFPLGLPQLTQQPDEDGGGLRIGGQLRPVPQAQAVGFLQRPPDPRILEAGPQQPPLARRGALTDLARTAVIVVDHLVRGDPECFLRCLVVRVRAGSTGWLPTGARCIAEIACGGGQGRCLVTGGGAADARHPGPGAPGRPGIMQVRAAQVQVE